MKCSYHWLKEFVDFDFTPDKLGERLTLLGLEVDTTETVTRNIRGAVVGEITEKTAENQCTVNIGNKTASAISLSALPQFKEVALLPNLDGDTDYQIASYNTLGIFEDDSPAFVGNSFKPGVAIESIIPIVDAVYDLDITPNRPDCMSMYGIAREISALTGNPIKRPAISLNEIDTPAQNSIKIKMDTPEGCPRYSAKVIKNVTIGPPPLWMYDRLIKAGLRSLNNIVDITNYVLIEYGFPLHAFDYSFIEKNEIIVRLSKKHEMFKTLDEKTHTLKTETVLICDGNRPVALGGIMGGLNSEVNESTKDVLLECAYFDAKFVRRSASSLGISTEASIRFGRGVDPNGILVGSDRAAELIGKLANGEVLKGTVDEYVKKIEETTISLRLDRIERVLGVAVSSEEAENILTRLGCKTSKGKQNDLTVQVPTFRPDLYREIDLIEEIARFVGFDKIPESAISLIPMVEKVNHKIEFLNRLKEMLRGNGFHEVMNNSMIPTSDLSLRHYPGETAKLVNPLSEDMAILRPSLLPSLIQVAQFNLFRQQENIKIYEIGGIFSPDDSSYKENLHLSGLLIGNETTDHWKYTTRKFNFYDLKGLIDDIRGLFSLEMNYALQEKSWAVVEPYLHLTIANKEVGILGKLDPTILSEYDILEESFIFELNLDNIIPSLGKEKKFHAIPKHPWVRRDIALIMDYDIPGGNLIKKFEEWGGEYLKEINIFDVYDGEQVPVGKKSLAFALKFQADERTLVEDDVNPVVDEIILKAKQEFNATLRS